MFESFPEIISTERLVIRQPAVCDAAELNAAILETWEQLHFWMDWARKRPTMEDSQAVCDRMAASTTDRPDLPLFCFDRETGKFVIASGVRSMDTDVPSFSVGYWCRLGFQGCGLVTEAVMAITEACFDSLAAHRVEIRCDVTNRASRRVAERCGYRLEGEMVNECRNPQGELRTTLVFARTI